MEEQTGYSEDLFGDVSESDVAEMTEADQAEGMEETQDEQTHVAENASDLDEVFTVKYMGEEKQLKRDEMIEQAQKGMDYDRIRTKYDALKEVRAKYDTLIGKINALSGDGVAPEEFLESMANLAQQNAIQRRAQELAANGECTDEFALKMAQMEYQQSLAKRREAQLGRAEKEREAQRREVGQFIMKNPEFRERFPDAQIPKEMVDAIQSGATIAEAWQGFQLKEAMEKIKYLEGEITRSEQARKNAGAAAPKVSGDRSMENDPFVMALMGESV